MVYRAFRAPKEPQGQTGRRKQGTRLINLYVDKSNDDLIKQAWRLATEQGVTFGELVLSALDDYLTLHQECKTNEVRANLLAADYDRQRRMNGL